MNMKEKIDELERRVRELESRPPAVTVIPYQVPYQVPIYVHPYPPYYGPWNGSTWCGNQAVSIAGSGMGALQQNQLSGNIQ